MRAMRRLAAVLLAALCLCCQAAWAEEITVTEGQLTYTVKQGKWEKYVNVTGYDLPEGQNYVYIPETWRGMPVYAKGESIPEQVEVVYIPWTRGTIASPDGRALMNALYVCAEDAGAYKAEFRLSDLQEGDLVLLDVWNCRMENGQWVEQGGYLKREEIPAELDGHRLNTTSSAVTICQKMGECVYYRSPHNGSPTIMDAELPENAAELVIPRGLEGNAYCYIHSAALGDEIHTIYLPYEYSEVHITDGMRQDSATYCLIVYADYETVMAVPELKGKFRGMDENDYALVEAKLRYVNFATGHEQEQAIAFAEDSLPTHLRGHRLHIFKMLSHKSRVKGDYQKALRGEFDAWMHLIDTDAVDAKPAEAEVTFDGVDQGIAEEGMFETDGWTYRAFVDKDGRKTANIVDFSIQTDNDSMVIPSTLDGYWVTGIELESIPASVQTVFMQEDGSSSWIITNSKPSKRKLTAVYYTDWEGAGRPAGMQQDELMWTRVITMDFADGVPRGSRVQMDALPTEIDGKKFIPPAESFLAYTDEE